MSGLNNPALDDIADGDNHAGDPVSAAHDVDVARIPEEDDDDE